MTTKLTMEQVCKYIAQDAGCSCPFCDSSSIEGKKLASEADRSYQEILCRQCGATWVDGYTLDSVGTGEGEQFEFLYPSETDENTAALTTREPLPGEADGGSGPGTPADIANPRQMALHRVTEALRRGWSSKSIVWPELALTDMLLGLVIWCAEHAVDLDAALAAAREQANGLGDCTAETHPHHGPGMNKVVAPHALGASETLVTPGRPGPPQGCHERTCGCDSKGQSGLVIKPPPEEAGDEPLFRVVYTIDWNAADPLAAAEDVYRIMTDPDSLPPVLDVMDHSGRVTRIDLSDTGDTRREGDRP